ncbi:putative alanyl-tRNA synthetase ['Chrysanthemum coronarium' phytoplasma]|uniref:Alanyl-tRNA synthetase n=1 Tax='Chrysanthemum coronarium' phytoplasma TaxID=1520703 RepID=A0ABQ0J230_9MOLU|nr:putative alanyl-tRNA synthetase ['Chrysanthemum coronarium' phytoplasma]
MKKKKNNLVLELNNIFNNMSLDSQTRIDRMYEISEKIDTIQNQLQKINKQIIARNQYNLQRQNNQNQPNNNRRH